MKIFISYSAADRQCVSQLAQQLRPVVSKLTYWDQDLEPGTETWPTIYTWIDQADWVLVVITDNTLSRAFAVGQEVGHARAVGKKIIPLVTPGIHTDQLGCLGGLTYHTIDPDNPLPAAHAVADVILKHRKQQAYQRALEKLETAKRQEENRQALAFGVLLVGAFALMAWDADK